MEVSISHTVFELGDLARLMRKDPHDPVIIGAMQSALSRAAALRFHSSMPQENDLRTVISELCFLACDWWRNHGAMLFGPDMARDKARGWEIAGHAITMTADEVKQHCLTRDGRHSPQEVKQ